MDICWIVRQHAFVRAVVCLLMFPIFWLNASFMMKNVTCFMSTAHLWHPYCWSLGHFARSTRELLKLNRNQWHSGWQDYLWNTVTWKVPGKRWISHTRPMWLWGYRLLKILSPGCYCTEPGDYQDTPLSKILHFVWSVGLLRGWNRRGYTVDYRWSWCKESVKANPLLLHYRWTL
jgi:hypothetical protein